MSGDRTWVVLRVVVGSGFIQLGRVGERPLHCLIKSYSQTCGAEGGGGVRFYSAWEGWREAAALPHQEL